MFLIQFQKTYTDGSKSVAYVSADHGLTELKSKALPVASADKARAIAAELQEDCRSNGGNSTVNAIPIDAKTAACYETYLD